MRSITFSKETISDIPKAELQRQQNFRHLYAEIAGFGILSGATLAFIAVYLTRLGASNIQIALLTAGPALVNLLVTLPAGQWIAPRRLTTVVFRSSVLHRLIYPLFIPLMLVATSSMQINVMLGLIILSSIPGALLAIAFNAMFADAVPVSLRGEVVGRRSALLALTILVTSLLSGQLLRILPFEQGYLIVFVVGAFGAAYSCYHLWRIRIPAVDQQRAFSGKPIGDAARTNRVTMVPDMPLQRVLAMRLITRVEDTGIRQMLAPLRTSFAPFLFALTFFHFAQFFPIPLFPIYWVREANLNDAAISILNATFYTTMFLASLRIGSLSAKFSNHRIVVITSLIIALYPLLTAFSHNITLLLVASLMGGAASALLGGAFANRLYERIPDHDRPRHFALYNLALNFAILVGALSGTVVANMLGIHVALAIAFGLRIVGGLLLARWG